MRLAYSGARAAPRSTRKTSPAPGRTDGLGVDLSAHYSDLRAVALSSYSRRCADAGVEIEELISVVAERILRSNRGARPYDPAKASLARYLHLLLSSRLSVLAAGARQAEARRARRTPRAEEEEDGLDLLDSVPAEPEVGDALRLVEQRLPELAREARETDSSAQDFPLAFLYSSWGGQPDPADPSWSGWREQAIRWVCGECPRLQECAAFWSVSAAEAASRLDWARAQWIAEIGA